MLEGILIGLQTALSIQNLLVVIGGCLIGTFIGMLPGLGPMSIIAIMIPVAKSPWVIHRPLLSYWPASTTGLSLVAQRRPFY